MKRSSTSIKIFRRTEREYFLDPKQVSVCQTEIFTFYHRQIHNVVPMDILINRRFVSPVTTRRRSPTASPDGGVSFAHFSSRENHVSLRDLLSIRLDLHPPTKSATARGTWLHKPACRALFSAIRSKIAQPNLHAGANIKFYYEKDPPAARRPIRALNRAARAANFIFASSSIRCTFHLRAS